MARPRRRWRCRTVRVGRGVGALRDLAQTPDRRRGPARRRSRRGRSRAGVREVGHGARRGHSQTRGPREFWLRSRRFRSLARRRDGGRGGRAREPMPPAAAFTSTMSPSWTVARFIVRCCEQRSATGSRGSHGERRAGGCLRSTVSQRMCCAVSPNGESRSKSACSSLPVSLVGCLASGCRESRFRPARPSNTGWMAVAGAIRPAPGRPSTALAPIFVQRDRPYFSAYSRWRWRPLHQGMVVSGRSAARRTGE